MRSTAIKCASVKEKLARLVEYSAFPPEESAVYQHLSQCDICQHYWTDLQLNKKLRALDVPPMQPGFVNQAIATAVVRGSRLSLRKTSNLWAMAAVLLLGVTLGFFLGDRGSLFMLSEPLSAPVELVVDQTRPVNVIIDSDVDIGDAVIRIVLADNMEIDGYPDTQELSWTAELRKGKNLLTLPLRIRDTGVGYLEVAYSDGLSEHKVRVDVTGRQPALKS